MSPAPLVLASELTGRPVVAIDCGDDIAEVKDVVYDPVSRELDGFTLNKRGWFRGNLSETLPTSAVSAIGPAAVMVDSADDLVAVDDTPDPLKPSHDAVPILGARVLSRDGEDLGEIADVVLETGAAPRAAGYRLDNDDGPVFVPIAAQMALSGDNLVLPEEARPFVRNDLAGFGAAVEDYRRGLDRAIEREETQ